MLTRDPRFNGFHVQHSSLCHRAGESCHGQGREGGNEGDGSREREQKGERVHV